MMRDQPPDRAISYCANEGMGVFYCFARSCSLDSSTLRRHYIKALMGKR